jgi:hypothetical protein
MDHHAAAIIEKDKTIYKKFIVGEILGGNICKGH